MKSNVVIKSICKRTNRDTYEYTPARYALEFFDIPPLVKIISCRQEEPKSIEVGIKGRRKYLITTIMRFIVENGDRFNIFVR